MNLAAQKLDSWLKDNGVLPVEFADQIMVDTSTVSKLVHGKRTPGLKLAARIFERTNKFVAPNDWLTPIDRQEETEVAA